MAGGCRFWRGSAPIEARSIGEERKVNEFEMEKDRVETMETTGWGCDRRKEQGIVAQIGIIAFLLQTQINWG